MASAVLLAHRFAGVDDFLAIFLSRTSLEGDVFFFRELFSRPTRRSFREMEAILGEI